MTLASVQRPRLLSPAEADGISLPTTSGGYAWWYFDALSDDGRDAFSLIFYYGSVFSPRYLGGLAAGRAPLPADYVAVSFQWYHGGARALWLFQEYGPSAWAHQREPFSLCVGRSRMDVSEGVISVRLDEQTPMGLHLLGHWSFTPAMPGFAPAHSLDAGGAHRWACAMPRARVKGKLETRLAGRTERVLAFHGTGYHDANHGTRPLWDDLGGWRWARAHWPHETRILYAPQDLRGAERAVSYRVDGAGVNASPAAVEMDAGPRTYLGLPRDARLRVDAGDGAWSITPDALWENGPFYHRWRGTARREDGLTVPAIGETLFPQRLRTPWVRWMAACRAYRRETGR